MAAVVIAAEAIEVVAAIGAEAIVHGGIEAEAIGADQTGEVGEAVVATEEESDQGTVRFSMILSVELYYCILEKLNTGTREEK